jgi:diadenosine tetraphosphate (Ap4A) HIT family hydrolase
MAAEGWERARRLRLPPMAQKVAKAQMKVFAADGITIQQFNESAGGQVVFHRHVHVIPRHDGVPMKSPARVKEEAAVLSDQALKLAAVLRTQPARSRARLRNLRTFALTARET